MWIFKSLKDFIEFPRYDMGLMSHVFDNKLRCNRTTTMCGHHTVGSKSPHPHPQPHSKFWKNNDDNNIKTF